MRKAKYHGKIKEYYSNGKLKEERTYFNGDLNGTSKYYYQNGKLKLVEHYILDDLYGWSEAFNKDGSALEKIYFYNDRQIK